MSEERRGPALLYSDLVYASLSVAARVALEELMAQRSYEYQSDFAKKRPWVAGSGFIAHSPDIDEGRE